MVTVNQIQAGQTFEGYCLIKSAIEGKTTKGDPFLTLILSDKTGEIEGKLWSSTEEHKRSFIAGKIVKVKGDVTSFRNQNQIRINEIRLAKENEVNTSNFIKTAPESKESLQVELEAFITIIQNPLLRAITNELYESHKEQFLTYPAAKSNHHAFSSGLAYHTVSMLRIAKSLAAQYKQLNADLLYSGIILHDLGKVHELEYTSTGKISYTTKGQLYGHITIIAILIDRTVQHLIKEKNWDLTEEDELLVMKLTHITNAHHNKLEWGSPVEPKLLEAEIVHYIDMIDSRINMITEGLEGKEEGQFHPVKPLGYFLK
ncbi:3'-5' exoribonuclease YhaM family protein [Calidifontibacillus erzurumensis]|uniref:3'-5' exoribonuclease YhaM family protein n=1 Tax=Calidifontibacillus erzurumensis TaxID=2741433 RepID=UPI0035B53591